MAEYTGEEEYFRSAPEKVVDKTTLYLTKYTKAFPYEVMEVDVIEASLNFDEYYNLTVVKGIDRMDRLQYFSAKGNLLSELPKGVANDNLRRLEVPDNRLTTLPFFSKNSKIEYFDISNNPLALGKGGFRHFYMPAGSTLDISGTGILCDEVCIFIRKNPKVRVISDCECD